MTVNEMIEALQKLANCGYGDATVRTWDDDVVEDVQESPYVPNIVFIYWGFKNPHFFILDSWQPV